MAVGDATYIKKINRSSILRHIIKEGMISRADLSPKTSLTRATISAQVSDLLVEGLIIEKEIEHSSVGRKPIALSLNSQAGLALGIDLDFGQIVLTLSDLLGQPLSSSILKLDTTNYTEVHNLLIDQINDYKQNAPETRYGIVGIGIAIHGLVGKSQRIHYSPRLQWNEIDLKGDLETQFTIPIYIENNANLCSFAERIYVYHDTENLLSVSLYSGIGLGMIMNDAFYRGHDGYAGEAGHMIVVPNGRLCTCGNKGCWENYASESSFFNRLSEIKQLKNLSFEQVQKWWDEGDQHVNDLMEEYIFYLSIGLNNIITIYNPATLVLDSALLKMDPDSLTKIRSNLNSSINHYRELALSRIGRKSAVLGACSFAVKQFLDVSMLSFPLTDQIDRIEQNSKMIDLTK